MPKFYNIKNYFFNKFLFSFDCYINLTMYESKNFLSVFCCCKLALDFQLSEKNIEPCIILYWLMIGINVLSDLFGTPTMKYFLVLWHIPPNIHCWGNIQPALFFCYLYEMTHLFQLLNLDGGEITHLSGGASTN